MPKPLALLLAFGLLLPAATATGEAPRQGGIIQAVLAEGFENVGVEVVEGRVTVWFENRKYRYDMTALGVVAAVVTDQLDEGTLLELIPENRNVPLISLSAPSVDWAAFLRGDLSAESFRADLEIRERRRVGGAPLRYPGSAKANRSYFRTDLALRPIFGVQVGAPSEVFEYTLAIAPEATMSPFYGGLLTLQVAYVIHDDLDPCGKEYPCGATFRPVRNTLSWGTWLPEGFLFAASGGTFPADRWGFAGEVGKLYFDGQLEVWAKADVWGDLFFGDDVIVYSNLKDWTAYGALTHRLEGLDLITTIRGGRFSEGWDPGSPAVRIDFTRRFHEFEIGFFGAKNERETTAGFTLKIPLPVRKYLNPSTVRPTTVPEFPFYYQDTVFPVANELSMYDNMDRLRKRLYPTFIRTNIEDLRRANRYLYRGESP